jgi:hypothetical protein
MVVNYKIKNFLSSWSADDQQPRVDFTILGSPESRMLRHPRIYDPKARDKVYLGGLVGGNLPPNTPLKASSEEAFMWVMTAPLLLFKDSVLLSTESDNLIKNPTII